MVWKTLHSEIVLKNKFFSVQKDRCQKTDGRIVENYYTVHRPNAAIIAAFTPKMRLIMIHKYRHPVKAADYEIPAGFINNSVHFFIGFNAKKIAEQKKEHSIK